MPSAFRGRLESDRRRAGLSVARLSWMLGVSVREYRELVEGEAWPSYSPPARMRFRSAPRPGPKPSAKRFVP
jgi:hypothetical protein